MRLRRFHIAPLLALLTIAAQSAQAVVQTNSLQISQAQRDPRDLSPLPRPFPDTYTGDSDSDTAAATPVASPSPAPTQTPAPVAAATAPGKKRKKSKKNQHAQPQAPVATVNPLATGSSSNVTTANAPRSSGQKFIDRFDVFYGLFLNGPSLGSSWGTTYSPFQQDTWPMYIYHTMDMQYHLDRNSMIGMEVSAHEDLFSGITPSKWSTPANPELSFNDPQLWYKRKSVLNNRYFSTDLQFDVWPAVTSYSVNQMGEYFSAGIDSTWNLKLRDYRWTAYFTTRLRPYIYGEYQPGDTYNRDWFDFAAGYYVGYNLTPHWQVNVSGVFDGDLYANSAQMANLGQFSDDTAQLELNYFVGHIARIGTFFQTVVTSPSLVNSIVGLDITVNFLTAR